VADLEDGNTPPLEERHVEPARTCRCGAPRLTYESPEGKSYRLDEGRLARSSYPHLAGTSRNGLSSWTTDRR
jgi:hypothetical protein